MIGRRHFCTAASAVGLSLLAGGAARVLAATEAKRAKIVLLGDCLFNQAIHRDDAEIERIRSILTAADLTVANFEGALADPGNYATLVNPNGVPSCGGSNVRGAPEVPGDLAWLGVDMVGTANNHALDWGTDGLLATLRKLDAAGIARSGTGRDLPAARAPAYHRNGIGRTALISCSSTYWPGALASRGNAGAPGRPGLNPLRYLTGQGDSGTASWVRPDDLREIVDRVREARAHTDRVIVSCHTHEGKGDWPPEFLQQFAKACIDAGAFAVFSHGPHKLRGIEIYRRRPIFYSLGAFIYRALDDRPPPEELFENCNIDSRDPEDLFQRKYREWEGDVPFWQSAIAELEVVGDEVARINLIPIILRHGADRSQWGAPALADADQGQKIIERMARLSKPFGTAVASEKGVGIVTI